MNELSPQAPKAVLICGLGQLGQHCAIQLKELGIPSSVCRVTLRSIPVYWLEFR